MGNELEYLRMLARVGASSIEQARNEHMTVTQNIHDDNVDNVLVGPKVEIEGRMRQIHSLVARKHIPLYEWERQGDSANYWEITFGTSRGVSSFSMQVPRADLLAWAKKIVERLEHE